MNPTLERTARIFTHMLDKLEAPIKLSGKDLESDEAAAPDGLLPLFVLEACSVWEAISNKTVVAPIRPDAESLLGIRVTDTPNIPTAIYLLCLAESAASVLREIEPSLTIEDKVKMRQILSADALISRWAEQLEELRNEPLPQPTATED